MEEPTKDTCDWKCEWAWPSIVIALFCIGLLIYLWPQGNGYGWSALPFSVGLVVGMFWAVRCFTGDPYQRRSQTVIYAYFFVIASFLLLCIPLVAMPPRIGGEPIGIISGCVANTEAKELKCAGPAKAPEDTGKESKKVEGKTNPAAEDKSTVQWLINIGGTLEPREPSQCGAGKQAESRKGDQCRFSITGGIVVPLYFVILALFGGAVSLSRRVPEIQKRSEDSYVGTATEPKLQPGDVREGLAFQILQYISAPLIAVTAYQVIQPNSAASSAALAFMSGFGSESVLLMIRGVVNGIKPQSLTASPTGTVSGVVTDNGLPVPNLSVNVAGTNLNATTDNAGKYILREVPVGPRDIAATGRNLAGKGQVAVQAAQTAICDIALKRTGAVNGVVKDAAQAPVAGATVTVTSQPSLKPSTTNEKGEYLIEGVPEGSQEISAQKASGATKRTGTSKVSAIFDKTTNCDITVS